MKFEVLSPSLTKQEITFTSQNGKICHILLHYTFYNIKSQFLLQKSIDAFSPLLRAKIKLIYIRVGASVFEVFKVLAADPVRLGNRTCRAWGKIGQKKMEN